MARVVGLVGVRLHGRVTSRSFDCVLVSFLCVFFFKNALRCLSDQESERSTDAFVRRAASAVRTRRGRAAAGSSAEHGSTGTRIEARRNRVISLLRSTTRTCEKLPDSHRIFEVILDRSRGCR